MRADAAFGFGVATAFLLMAPLLYVEGFGSWWVIGSLGACLGVGAYAHHKAMGERRDG